MSQFIKTNLTVSSEKKLVIKNTIMYLFAVGMNRGMSFLLIPLLTNLLNTEEYGIISIAAIITGLLKNVIALNPSIFLIVNFFRIKKEELGNYISNIFALIVATSIILFLIYYFLGSSINFFTSQTTTILAVIFLTALLTVIESVVLTLVQMEKKGNTFFFFSLISASLQLTFVIILVVIVRGNWQGKIYADLLAELAICIILVIYLQINYPISRKTSWEKIKQLLVFLTPLLPHSICIWGMNFIDRFFLERIIGLESVGIYSAAYNLGLGLMLIYDAMQRSWQPYFFEFLEKNDETEKRKIVKFTWLYFIFAILLFLILTAIAYFASPIIYGKDFQSAFEFIPLIFLGYTFHGMYRAIAGHLYFLNKNRLLALITVSSAILNIALNYLLITKNGVIGAAQSTALTFFYLFVVVLIFVLKEGNVPWFYFLEKQTVEHTRKER